MLNRRRTVRARLAQRRKRPGGRHCDSGRLPRQLEEVRPAQDRVAGLDGLQVHIHRLSEARIRAVVHFHLQRCA